MSGAAFGVFHMSAHPPHARLSFYCEEPFRGFARLEGNIILFPDSIQFEYAMTGKSAGETPQTVIKHLAYLDIHSIELRTPWLNAPRLRFRSKSPDSLESFPITAPSVFEVEIPAQARAGLEVFHQCLMKSFEKHQEHAFE